jgi:hypothetical protein
MKKNTLSECPFLKKIFIKTITERATQGYFDASFTDDFQKLTR